MYEARPAGFWVRAAALVIDLLVLLLVDRSLGVVARRTWGATADETLLHGMIGLFTLVFSALYVILLTAGTGQTIGKMAVRAHVVLLDGEPVPLGASLLRFFAYALSCLPLGLGYVMAGLRHDKRALHDLIAGTRVERRLPVRAPAALEPTESALPPLA